MKHFAVLIHILITSILVNLSAELHAADLDWGDAPAPYPTLSTENGARHVPTGPKLGTARDTELDGRHTPTASGDDNAGDSDEDGVVVSIPFLPGQTALLNIMASGPGRLDAWMDFNRDGDWADEGEQIAVGLPVSAGINGLPVAVPASAAAGPTFARFRISRTGGLGFTGLAPDGEVEDHTFVIETPPTPCLPRVHQTQPPNVIVIVADDLGYTDLGVQGSRDIPTPFIDSLARNGVRCTSGYVTAPVCSPSRAALMTGRYQQRFGHETNPGTSLERHPRFGLPTTETTMGERFKDLGYATGWIGKSHLGGVTNIYHPMLRGFDEYFGFIESHHDYFPTGEPLRDQKDPVLRGFRPINETNYLTTAFARECVDFIGRHTNDSFFLYAPFNAIHFPLQAPTSLQQRAAALNITDPQRREIAAVLMGLDDAVGAILARLRTLNLETNTLIFFTSDNGGTVQLGSVNRPLRGGKTEVYEGGIRVPFFVQWKGHLQTNQIFNAPVSTMDILPTALAAAGGSVSPSWQLDGVNLFPFFCGQSNGVPHPTLFWRIETNGETPSDEIRDGIRAMREGDWKLVKPGVLKNWELYNLALDIGETTDVAESRPDVVQRMVRAFDAWAAELARPRWAVDNLIFALPEFILEDIRLGIAGRSYLAPRFSPAGAHLAFQDETNSLWRADVDLGSGFLVSGGGHDLLVDAGLAPLTTSISGSEWGLSTNGPALFYNKADGAGLLQLWRAASLDAGVTPVQLGRARTNLFDLRTSQEGSQPSAKIAFAAGNAASASLFWSDETNPASALALPRPEFPLRNGRWLPGTEDFGYIVSAPGGRAATQLARYSTRTQALQILSDDQGEKNEVCGFIAPEFNGELCYAAIVDRTSIAIYRDLRDRPGGLHTRIFTIAQPTNRPQYSLYSIEPLLGARGLNGTSYFTVAGFQNDDRRNPGDSVILLLGLGPDDDDHWVQRVDEGLGGAIVAERRDPRAVLGENEILVYYSRQTGTNPMQLRVAGTGVKRPEFPGAPGGFTTLEFSRSFTAGTNDPRGNLMSSTEVMNLVAHGGRLFAATGNRQNLPIPAPNSLPAGWTGAQILVKDSAATPWRVDEATPPIFRQHLRAETLVEFTFSTNGTSLAEPRTMLIAGLSDLDPNSAGARLATVRTRRDAAPAAWFDSHVATTRAPANVISIGSHVDRATRVHHIFAGLENGEIYRGSYDEREDSRLSWASHVPEFSGAGPVTALASCNGRLYAACGLRQTNRTQEITGGLFVRNDTNASWTLVYRWPHPADVMSAPQEQLLLRGLTVVPDPRDQNRQVLLAARAWPGVIERIDPDPERGHRVVTELDVRDFFARLRNDDRIREGSVTLGYTGFTPVTNAATGERVHLVGVWLQYTGETEPPNNGSHFLVRHLDGTYELADIGNLSPGLPAGESLRGTRSIAASPFPEDQGGVFYFGGYDTGADESHDTAWILRGAWSDWPRIAIRQAGPSERVVSWPAMEAVWALEASASVGGERVWRRVPGRSTRSTRRETQSVEGAAASGFFRLRKE